MVGKLPTLEVTMQVGATTETVEVTGAAPLVDTSQSKVQTNITSDILADAPTGRSYQSVIQFAPGARVEPLQAPTGGNAITGGFSNHQGTNQGNGFQIDGASNTENSYLVEGQETASAFDGASAANVPMEFIQEVQVKSSGFEAEHGGALGGVVNVLQKRGTNDFHGSVFTYYSADRFDAAPSSQLRGNPQTSASTATRTDQTPQFYQPAKDHYNVVEPGFELGGPLIKNRLNFFISSVPRLSSLERTVTFRPNAPVPGAQTFHESINTYYSLARLDFAATDKIRLFGSWQYGYERGSGTTLPGADSPYGQYNTSGGANAWQYNSGIGYVAPNVIYSTGADITINPHLISTTRYGYFYQDYQDRGFPSGVRYVYRNTNYPYSTGSATNGNNPAWRAMDGSTLPAADQNGTSWSNIGVNQQTVYDKFKRWSFAQDMSWFKSAFGTHNIKFGYGFSKSANNAISAAFNTADIYVGYGLPYSPGSSIGSANCDTIIAQNVATYGAGATALGCQGVYGTVNIRDVATTGNVSGWNHGLYLQDAWTVGHGVTINAGVRTEKESVPSYAPGLLGIDFGFGQKVAPRLGAAWDVLGNQKIKVYGSFGYFYQVMNLQLARGSWGGDYWHDCVYALDIADFTQLVPTRDSQGHYCPLGGGNTPAVGTYSGLRFIENYDYRMPSNDPNAPGSLGPTGYVDPNLMPMKQHEMVFGSDIELRKNLGLELRYSRKRLDRTIEDAGTITPNGELYYIVNPGFGVNSKISASECTNCPANPKAIRNYDGIETRLTYRGNKNFFGPLSYTYSRYYGNYAGLTSTDQSDSNQTGGRNGANSDRAFDEPYMSFDANGKPINGPLSTDRPHTLKAYGYYTLHWLHQETSFGGFQQWYSGTPLSSYISVWGAPVFVEGRGNWANVTTDASGNWVLNGVSARRTPSFSQTDFSLTHSVHVSKTNEKLMASFEVNVINLFNQKSPVDFNSKLFANSGAAQLYPYECTSGVDCPVPTSVAGFDYASVLKGYDWMALANSAPGGTPAILNSLYGQPYLFQPGRTMRFKVKFSF
jgi:hypothetical protein